MEYHENKITSVDLLGTDEFLNDEQLVALFLSFISEFKTDEHLYANQLAANSVQEVHGLKIQLEHIAKYSQQLYDYTLLRPEHSISLLETALSTKLALPAFQVQLVSSGLPLSIRDVTSSRTNKIAKIEGIVVSCSPVRTKPQELFIMCRNCLGTKLVKDAIPRSCDRSECPIDPYVIIPEKSKVRDVQYVKIQEDFEDIPTGETPRHMSVLLEGALVDRVSPGNRVSCTGILQVRSNGEKSSMYLRVLGVENKRSSLRKSFTPEEESHFKMMSQDGIYSKLARSMAPGVYGHEDVKKALVCMLFGGTRRVRSDGIALRGDINILLLGDPGIAKSQLLKFVERVAPIGVYTSGKGSSAAGLTAAVIRDKHGEFYLEGGALVLADQGVCCIDEFDKMGESDRVAIHEAMEQQTISIAKAGITTMLNTRAAVLAAANPVFGRYDDYKTPAENIEFGSTILSRFDLIFILKDRTGPEDKVVAEHVLALHSRPDEQNEILAIDQMQLYIQYAKLNVFPVISAEAGARLSRFYVGAREEVAELGIRTAIPITVRQLEAVIRMSESLARIELKQLVTTAHVEEAIRLFQVSTMHAVSQGHLVEGMMNASFFDEINEVINKIKECMPVGTSRKYAEVLRAVGAPDVLLKRAVDCLVKQNKLISKDYGRVLVRLP